MRREKRLFPNLDFYSALGCLRLRDPGVAVHADLAHRPQRRVGGPSG